MGFSRLVLGWFDLASAANGEGSRAHQIDVHHRSAHIDQDAMTTKGPTLQQGSEVGNVW